MVERGCIDKSLKISSAQTKEQLKEVHLSRYDITNTFNMTSYVNKCLKDYWATRKARETGSPKPL